MNMKIVSKIYKGTAIAAAVALAAVTSSCTDYLTIIPADKVVEENFWQTKDQVNGMLATSYLKLLDKSAIKKAIVWGELRSESMTFNPASSGDIKNIVEADIIDENGYCDWGIYYEAISCANIVLESVAPVVDRDPDFSEGDRDVVMGEMYAIRALSHFYLVRTFRDIPLAMKSAKNDAEIPDYVQVHPMVALDSIMKDLDRAEKMVMKSGAFANAQSNYGRITTNAVLAMKADVNLWRAAFAAYYEGDPESAQYVKAGDAQMYYDKCVENCRKVITNMDSLFVEGNKGKPAVEYAYNLIQNTGDVKDKETTHISTAYNDIFGTKNSSESIFELQVQGDNVKNGFYNGVYEIYGSENKAGAVVVPSNFYSNFERDDLRLYSYTTVQSWGPQSATDDICIAKYAAKGSPAANTTSASWRKSEEWDANWIVYRRTDVLLMLAEALVTRESAGVDDFKEAFNIVDAINRRSRFNPEEPRNPLKQETYMTRDKAIELVRKERLLELSYEGKRWYDLVRLALREKSTDPIKFVADKLDSKSNVVKTKMKSIDGLFMPIHINELRYNKNLKQNDAYDKDDSSMEMN